jgi:hypothetical protein
MASSKSSMFRKEKILKLFLKYNNVSADIQMTYDNEERIVHRNKAVDRLYKEITMYGELKD